MVRPLAPLKHMPSSSEFRKQSRTMTLRQPSTSMPSLFLFAWFSTWRPWRITSSQAR